MQREPCELDEDQIHKLIVAGVEPDRIEVLNEKRHEAYQALWEDTYGEDSIENTERHFYNKYGFEHVCTCVDDVFTGNVIEIPRCRHQMGDDALDALDAVNIERDELAEKVTFLRQQLLMLGESPVV